MTYTYNGEGSDKKLYLDGRLVDTAKNEDTFGDYPPFAMTNYSEYGYTVSASSELAGGGYKAGKPLITRLGAHQGEAVPQTRLDFGEFHLYRQYLPFYKEFGH